MTLEQYIQTASLTHEQFGKLVGASRVAVGKWCRGERTPRPNYIRAILEATDGQVTPADFYEEAS